MSSCNPAAKGAVEAAFQHLASQNARTFAATPFRRNSGVSTCQDSSLSHDRYVRIVAKAIVKTNQAF